MRARLALVSPLFALAVLGTAGAQGPATSPTAAASAWAVQIVLPGAQPLTTTNVTVPPAAAPAAGGAYLYPADGSVVTVQSTTATASANVTRNAAAKAEGVVTGVSLFGGAITADAVTAAASAGTGPSGAGGNAEGSGLTNLLIAGQAPAAGATVQVADWGVLTLGKEAIDRTSGEGVHGYHGAVTELELKLLADHGGLPAGTLIRLGHAEVAVETAPPTKVTTTTAKTPPPPPTTTVAQKTPAQKTPAQKPPPPAVSTGPDVAPTGDVPSSWPRRKKGKLGAVPLDLSPKLTAARYVFPVYGESSYIDTYGAPRSDENYHHGDDIFGTLGQPLLAVSDGTVFSVGWNKIGGNRLWIVDSQGNQFYYAHLSAFATSTVNGAHVKAGQVVGFMGHTGDAEGTPVHLHFEAHPVSLLYLGYDGAVDPTPYLDAWKHQQDLAFPSVGGWIPAVPGGTAPEPGAILLHMSDIGSANGLDPASLERALAAPRPAALLRSLPVVVTPTRDLGKG